MLNWLLSHLANTYLLLVSGYARALVKSIKLLFFINDVLYAFYVDNRYFNSLNIDVLACALFIVSMKQLLKGTS